MQSQPAPSMHLFLFPLEDPRKRLDYSKKMHIHMPTTVWIQFLGVSPQIHILKSNPDIMVSENRPSRGNRFKGGGSWAWLSLTKAKLSFLIVKIMESKFYPCPGWRPQTLANPVRSANHFPRRSLPLPSRISESPELLRRQEERLSLQGGKVLFLPDAP